MTLGQRIRYVRKERKLTMDELGEKIGVKGATISRYESGVISVPSPKVEALAAALDVTPGYLMGWTDHPDQLDVLDMLGMTAGDRAAAYADAAKHQARKSEKRRALEALVNSATEEEIDLITHLVEAVLKNRK